MWRIVYLLAIFTLFERSCSVSVPARAFRDLNRKVNLMRTSFQRKLDDLEYEVLDLKTELHVERTKTARLEALLNSTDDMPQIGSSVINTPENIDVMQLEKDVDGLENEVAALNRSKESAETGQGGAKEQCEQSVSILKAAFSDQKARVIKFVDDITKQTTQALENSESLKKELEGVQNDARHAVDTAMQNKGDIMVLLEDIQNMTEKTKDNSDSIVSIKSDIQQVAEKADVSEKRLNETQDMLQELKVTTAKHEKALKSSIQEIEDLEEMVYWTENEKKCRKAINAGGESMAKLLYVGVAVKRGKDWKWGDQDEEGQGTVTKVDVNNLDSLWIKVTWDNNGHSNSYRMGVDGAYDLMIVAEKYDYSRCPV